MFSIVRIVPHFAFNLTLSNVSNGCRVTVEGSTPCKGIRIAESERFLLMESGIQLKESGIRLTIRIRNASSTGKVRNPIPGIRNPGRRIQNPRLFTLIRILLKTQLFFLRFQNMSRPLVALSHRFRPSVYDELI